MQTCDLLKHMSVEDLTQRYENTVVEYGGKWVTVAAFEKLDGERTPRIHWIEPNGARNNEPFDWQKLNTERLPSRWYYRLEDGAAAFLSYIPARQWKRGYANENTRLFHPNGAMRFRAENGDMFSKQAGKTVINRWTNADALAERLGTTDAILSEDFCMSFSGALWFREYMIGRWKPTLRKIHLMEDIFVDEMRDLGMIHLLATDKELKAIQKTDDEEKPWIKDLRRIMQEQDDRAEQLREHDPNHQED